MGFFTKTEYEKHSNNLHKKLVKITEALESYELKEICQKLLGKYPKNGTRLFDSDYNLICKFGHRISNNDYLLFFTHYRLKGKCSDLKLAKFLILKDILDGDDPDFNYLKQFARSEDSLDYATPRINFPQKVKDAIRKIQKNSCAHYGCKNKGFFEFDHIRGRDDNSLSNCQMLCMYHHRIKTNEDAIKLRIEKNLNEGQKLEDIRVRNPTKNSNRRTHTATRTHTPRQSSHRRNSSRKTNSRKSRR
jgi:hypothetical protein